jgi:hypothetical protein
MKLEKQQPSELSSFAPFVPVCVQLERRKTLLSEATHEEHGDQLVGERVKPASGCLRRPRRTMGQIPDFVIGRRRNTPTWCKTECLFVHVSVCHHAPLA